MEATEAPGSPRLTVGMSAGHTAGFQLAGTETLVIMSLNNSAGEQERLAFICMAFVSPILIQ